MLNSILHCISEIFISPGNSSGSAWGQVETMGSHIWGALGVHTGYTWRMDFLSNWIVEEVSVKNYRLY